MLVAVSGSGAPEGEEGAPTGGGGDVYSSPARYLFQKVQILAVGQTRKLEPGETAATNPDGSPVTSGTSGLLTFAVPAEAAQKIASVEAGAFYLTLDRKSTRLNTSH